ncbi:DUF1203 domain-containing protein [Phenylobacterium sp.]|jgi:hypothetical protein|uniref:DUF1203 domain-containing protein n=1 Tax=Phenylobacterium sp. TaxID=1871053 RepID=UPI002F9284D0
MSYIVSGLPLGAFQPLFGLADAALAQRGVIRMRADARPGFPCRITLEDAAPGDTVLLLNYEHQAAATPYRSSHAIFVNESAREAARYVASVPPALAVRPMISLRAFDEAGMMVDAALAPGAEWDEAIRRLLAAPGAAYLHAHNAGRGCYAARVDRA